MQTVSVVGYAAAGVGGALLAALIAFSPSFVFILAGARHFGALRTNRAARSWAARARRRSAPSPEGPSRCARDRAVWQVFVLAGALVLIVGLRRSVVLVLVGAGVIGAMGAALGLPVGG